MITLLFLFALLQAAGAVVGAGGSVFAEIFYLRAMQDGKIDNAERAHLRIVATGLRWGMFAVLLGSLGLVVIDYLYDLPQPALTTAYWIEMTLAVCVIFFSWAVSRRRVSFMVGSAGIFTGWWLLALLLFGRLPLVDFGVALTLYVVCTVLMAIFLSYARMVTRVT